MSRALALSARVEADAYQTPDALALAICRRLARWWARDPQEIVEPSAGDGAFVRGARRVWPGAKIKACDLTPDIAGLRRSGATSIWAGDWRVAASEILTPIGPDRLIIGNPPYREAEEHIGTTLPLLREGEALAFLLRLNFLGSVARLAFWRKHRPTWVAPVVPRPSFMGGGSDATEYALFCWVAGRRSGRRLVAPVVWR